MILLALLSAAFAKPKDKPEPAPEPVPAATPGDAQRAAEFTGWATALASGNRKAATDALLAILDDPSKAYVQGEAWGHLGEAYADAGLPLAAIGAMGKALALDPAHGGQFVAKGLALVDQTHESGLIGEALGNNVGIRVDPALRNRLAIVASRYQLEHGSYGPAVAILMMADKDQAGFEDVELLRGVVLSQQGQYTDAIAPLLTASALGIQKNREPQWLNTAALDLARAYYSSGNYGEAINWYGKVDRTSDYWLDAQFERAWAHFRGDNVNGALAMLFNHESVFFADFYYPEADLLRAYSLFVMCKFTDAGKQMDDFQARYEPIKTELAGLQMSPEAAWEDFGAFRAEKPTKLPEYVLRPYRHEQRLTDALASVEEADSELGKAAAMGGKEGDLAKDLISTQREARIQTEGARVLDRVDSAEKQLGSMLEGIEITRLDLLNLETQMFERASVSGKIETPDPIAHLRDLNKTKRGFHVWPWQEEYWADELGWYVFNARPDCPDTMARGDLGKPPPPPGAP